MTRLEQQMNFILEMDGLKKIGRQTYLKDGSRKENDAEHSWHLAMMALVLQEYAGKYSSQNENNEKGIDVLRVISMVLIHDVVELDAGDTYAYDDAANATKRERELAAAERIFQLLPGDQASFFRDIWDEFEASKTEEALFAHALDNIQPTMLNDASGAKAWREHMVKLSQVLKRNENTAEGSQELWDYSKEHFIMPNVANGAIQSDQESQ